MPRNRARIAEACTVACFAPGVLRAEGGGAIVVDHTGADRAQVPAAYITPAKSTLRVS